MKTLTPIAVIFLAGLICCIYGQDNPTPDQVLAKVNEVIDIPELKNLNTSALPIEEGKNLLRKKCEKNGGAAAFENAHKATEEVVKCVSPLVNRTELEAEMEKARPTGDLDLVFKKYCKKKPILQKCITNYMDAIEPCLDTKERENRIIVQNITDSLLSFVCFKDGDRIALFIAAGGPECFQSKQAAIQQCANSTLQGYTLPNTTEALANVENIPSLIFDKKVCGKMDKLQACAVKELEACDDPTPANLVDSIFNFIKKVTPCEKLLANKA